MSRCFISQDFTKKVGLDEKNFNEAGLAKFDKETGIIHFFPSKIISKHFSTHIKDYHNFNFSEKKMIEIVKQYTTHDSWYCSKINLLLAADSIDLNEHSEYIAHLLWCIKKLAILYPIKENRCYRGYDCSDEEFNSYKLGEYFYIPSFLSSSKNPKKFYQACNHNTLMVIDLFYRPNNAFVVNEKFSIYAENEEEVLFSCYSRFKVTKKSKNFKFNNKIYEFYIQLEHNNVPSKNLDEKLKNVVCFNLFFK